MTGTVTTFSIPGAEDETILGNTHLPTREPEGVVIVAHGFKGYKDYGMFPRIAATLADAGFIAHRFNFGHSGMTERIETFERPDLFERDTWNKQVADLRAVVEAVASGDLAGQALPYVLFGHSRGGVSVLLAAGRWGDDPSFPQPAGIITAATPSSCNPFSPQEQEHLLRVGSVSSPSARTGQELRVGRGFLQEQLDDPAAHDLLRVASNIRCAALIIHGSNDPTVPSECAYEIGRALGERANELIIDGADHVFKTPNPMPADAEPSPQLRQLLDAAVSFAHSVCERVED
jgi:alpha-beta hydrolase superfamily lysophospholipase